MTTPAPQTPQQRLEAERAAIDAMTDTAEQALALAVLRAKVALAKGEKADLLRAQSQLEQYRRQRDSVRFKVIDSRQEPCVLSYLRELGYQAEKSKVCAEAKQGKLLKRDGFYYGKDIEVYARTWCRQNSTPALPESPANGYKEEIARETARKLKMANDTREGELIERSLVEQELAARLAFLKRDLFNLGPRMVDRLCETFSVLAKEQGHDLDGFNLHGVISDLEQVWDKNMTAYLDSYARPRGFVAVGEPTAE